MLQFSKARAWVFGAAIGATALSASARADVLFDSLGWRDSEIVGSPALALEFDASFQTGASPVRVSDIALSLNSIFYRPGDTFTVSIFGGVPLADVEFIPALGLNAGPGETGGPALASVTLPDLGPLDKFDRRALQPIRRAPASGQHVLLDRSCWFRRLREPRLGRDQRRFRSRRR